MKVLLVDGFNLIRRIYEARDTPDIESVINASVQSLQRALREHDPTHGVVVSEKHDRTWRHLLYSDYKAGRSPTPQELLDNTAEFEHAFNAIGVKSFVLDSYEADDVIATFAQGVAAAGNPVIILSSDKLYLQLLSEHIQVVNHFEHQHITAADVENRYGVTVQQLVDYWALVGDSSNNIKGVPGVGAKTASRLLTEYGDLANIMSGPEDDAAVRKIVNNETALRRCRQLVTLKTDIELGTNLREFRIR